MPVTEIAWFKSSAAFQADHTLLNPLVEKLRKLEGLVSTHLGFQTEDPSVAYIVNTWQTPEQHAAITKHESYGEIFGSLKPACEDQNSVEMIVVESAEIPQGALDAPTTEIAVVTLKAAATKEGVLAVFDKLSQSGVTKGYHYGPLVGKEGLFATLVGWESVEAHQAAQKDSGYAATLAQAAPLVEPKIVHAKFWKA